MNPTSTCGGWVDGFGTGGYGTVYRVKRKGDGQLFAIKCNLPPSLPLAPVLCTWRKLPLLLLHTFKPIGSVFTKFYMQYCIPFFSFWQATLLDYSGCPWCQRHHQCHIPEMQESNRKKIRWVVWMHSIFILTISFDLSWEIFFLLPLLCRPFGEDNFELCQPWNPNASKSWVGLLPSDSEGQPIGSSSSSSSPFVCPLPIFFITCAQLFQAI
jgi:hypothetical protein